jgi:hypothetical protein
LGDSTGPRNSTGYFQKDNTNYTLPYYPVFSAPNLTTGINNAVGNAVNFITNMTVGQVAKGGQSINNYFAGGYKESTTDPITAAIDWTKSQSEYISHTPFSQQLKELGSASTDLKNYELPAQLALGTGALSRINLADKVALSTTATVTRTLVPLTEETFSQALIRGAEKIGDYEIWGTKGLVGKTFNRNIFYLDASRKSLAGFRSLIQNMESEAINAGANRISIYGSSIIRDAFFNPNIAARFGYSFEKSGTGVILQKTLK